MCKRNSKGEKYLKETYIFEGRFYCHKTCRHCNNVRKYFNEIDHEFCYGCIYEDLSEHVYNITKEDWMPRLMLVGMSRKWKRKDGKMWREIK